MFSFFMKGLEFCCLKTASLTTVENLPVEMRQGAERTQQTTELRVTHSQRKTTGFMFFQNKSQLFPAHKDFLCSFTQATLGQGGSAGR